MLNLLFKCSYNDMNIRVFIYSKNDDFVIFVYFYSILLNTLGFSKKMSFCHKLWFYNPYNFGTRCRIPKIFQSLNLKYQRFGKSGSKDKGVRKSEFVAKTQFLCDRTKLKLLSFACIFIYLLQLRTLSTVSRSS